jgi:histidine ammonia-lyase
MATFAARRLTPMVANTARIVAIELLAAAQGVDLRRPLATSPKLAAAMKAIRTDVPFWDRDRAFAPDLEAIRKRVERGDFVAFAPILLGEPHAS